jgi:hypothetical protein
LCIDVPLLFFLFTREFDIQKFEKVKICLDEFRVLVSLHRLGSVLVNVYVASEVTQGAVT